MIGQTLDLLANAASINLFYRDNDALMDVAASLAPQASVGDIVSESVLEGKLKVRKQLGGKHKFGRLQTVEDSREARCREDYLFPSTARVERRVR